MMSILFKIRRIYERQETKNKFSKFVEKLDDWYRYSNNGNK